MTRLPGDRKGDRKGARRSLSIEQEALIALLRSAGRVRRQFGSVVHTKGLTASQYNVLRILRGARSPLPIMTIRDRMMDPEPSITRLVDRLEQRGLVKRNRCSDDRRRIDCTITGDGLDLVNALDGPVDDKDREIMSALSDKELRTLVQLLDRVARGGG